eukprot:EG_transcript_18783
MRPPLDGRPPVGRLELLTWVNAALQTAYHRLEELCDGVAYAQLFDAVRPGVLSLSRLNLNAQTPAEYERNLSLLKDAFKRAGLPVLPPVEKLKTGRLADNQEFLQWLYAYLQDQRVDITRYPALDVRQAAVAKQLAAWERQAGRLSGKPPAMRPELLPNPAAVLRLEEKQAAGRARLGGPPVPGPARQPLPAEVPDARKGRRSPSAPPAPSGAAAPPAPAGPAGLQPAERQAVRQIIDVVEGTMVQRLTQQTNRSAAVMELKAEVDALYSRLRAVEDVCREFPDNNHALTLLALLTEQDPMM